MEVGRKIKNIRHVFNVFFFEVLGTAFLVTAIEMVVQKGGSTAGIALALFLGI